MHLVCHVIHRLKKIKEKKNTNKIKIQKFSKKKKKIFGLGCERP